MSNSSLVDYIKISPNSSNPRNDKIKKITIHHTAGDISVETLGGMWANPERMASSNYGIGSDGRVGMYVEEKNRSWCSSSSDNDNMAVTIEVANNGGAPDWPVSDTALGKLILLCADICSRNKIEKLNFTGDENGNLTMHKWFTATACPGPYLEDKFSYIASEVNKILDGKNSTDTATQKSIETLATEVIRGDWGNGAERKERLESAGYSYSEVQARVNEMLGGVPTLRQNSEVVTETVAENKSIETLAREVIRGDWGNGAERKERLESAGYSYSEVQARVNEMLGII